MPEEEGQGEEAQLDADPTAATRGELVVLPRLADALGIRSIRIAVTGTEPERRPIGDLNVELP